VQRRVRIVTLEMLMSVVKERMVRSESGDGWAGFMLCADDITLGLAIISITLQLDDEPDRYKHMSAPPGRRELR
jgi:hypothetical protein